MMAEPTSAAGIKWLYFFFCLEFWFVCISNFDGLYFSWTSWHVQRRAASFLLIAFFQRAKICARYGSQIDRLKKSLKFMAGDFHSESKLSLIHLLVKYIQSNPRKGCAQEWLGLCIKTCNPKSFGQGRIRER